MRRLLLLRHAKAIHPTGRDDFDRELIDRGRRDAERIGAFIAEIGMIPDLVVDSGAARTRATAAIVLAGWAAPVESRPDPRLYEATRGAVLEVVRGLDDAAAHVMLVGHNPSVA